jgi:hypothetical protein
MTIDIQNLVGREYVAVVIDVDFDGDAELVEVADASGQVCLLLAAPERREQHSGENPDDSDDHQQLNESKTGRLRTHPCHFDCAALNHAEFDRISDEKFIAASERD